MRINLRRRHDHDVQWREHCRRKAEHYEDVKAQYNTWVDSLTVQNLYQLVGAKRVKRVHDLKEAVRQQGTQQLDDLIEYWRNQADQGLVDPLAAARF